MVTGQSFRQIRLLVHFRSMHFHEIIFRDFLHFHSACFFLPTLGPTLLSAEAKLLQEAQISEQSMTGISSYFLWIRSLIHFQSPIAVTSRRQSLCFTKSWQAHATLFTYQAGTPLPEPSYIYTFAKHNLHQCYTIDAFIIQSCRFS